MMDVVMHRYDFGFGVDMLILIATVSIGLLTWKIMTYLDWLMDDEGPADEPIERDAQTGDVE